MFENYRLCRRALCYGRSRNTTIIDAGEFLCNTDTN